MWLSEIVYYVFFCFRMPKGTHSPLFVNKVSSEENLHYQAYSKGSGLSARNNGKHASLSTTNAFQSRRKVEMFIECTDLVQLDTFSRTDSVCVLYVKKLGQWTEYGRTESIPNNLHPKVR